MTDDQEQMARVKDGEQSALEQLFARWESPLFAFFYRLGSPPSAIEDLAEEVLVSLYRQRGRYDVGRPFAPWLYGIARLVWKDYLRRRGREMARVAPLEAAGGLAADAPGPSELADAREAVESVRQALRQLPEAEREAFVLRHYHGLSYHEVADALDVAVGTVKWRIHEAVRRLEASLPVARDEERRRSRE